MSKFDVEVSYEITGENQFGHKESLVASDFLKVEAESKGIAEDLATEEYLGKGIDVLKVVACQR